MYHFEISGDVSRLKRRPACRHPVDLSGWLARILLLCFAAALASCGSSGSGSAVREGVFIDSPVEGLYYVSDSHQGTTDSDGTFSYRLGEVVSFYIGSIQIGSAEGQDILTPLDFVPDAVDASHPEVTNILRFLQSLDEDRNPDNGITISDLTISQAEGQTLDFALSANDFELAANALLGVLTDGDIIELVDAAAALEHFETTVPGASGSGSSSSLVLSGADTVLFGSSLNNDPAENSVALDMNNTGSIVWREVQPDASFLEAAVVLSNGVIYDVLLTWTNNGGSGPTSATYAISCAANPFPFFTPGDCSQMSIDTSARQVTFDVSIAQTGLDGATAAISANGTFDY